MGRTQAGVQDGTGPVGGGIGRRQAAGLPCPVSARGVKRGGVRRKRRRRITATTGLASAVQ